jgi:hypothetical protein
MGSRQHFFFAIEGPTEEIPFAKAGTHGDQLFRFGVEQSGRQEILAWTHIFQSDNNGVCVYVCVFGGPLELSRVSCRHRIVRKSKSLMRLSSPMVMSWLCRSLDTSAASLSLECSCSVPTEALKKGSQSSTYEYTARDAYITMDHFFNIKNETNQTQIYACRTLSEYPAEASRRCFSHHANYA